MNKVSRDSCLESDVSSMKVHVATLDAFNGHRSHSREVLRQSDRDHHLGELRRRGVTHDLVRVDVRRVRRDCSTFGAN